MSELQSTRMTARAGTGANPLLCSADNALEALPESLGRCTNLVKLQASFNKLRTLPSSIGRLPKLELLRVACNRLEKVPLSLRQPRLSTHALQSRGLNLVRLVHISMMMRCQL